MDLVPGYHVDISRFHGVFQKLRVKIFENLRKLPGNRILDILFTLFETIMVPIVPQKSDGFEDNSFVSFVRG